jgi:hypothetical protein
MRDYDVVFEALGGKKESKGTYRLRFTHCPEVKTVTKVSDPTWRQSWSDVFIDHGQWIDAGEPDGFVWGSGWSCAYPGLSYIKGSKRAREWSKRLGKAMHQIVIETEAFQLQVVFHDFTVTKLNDEVHVLHKVMIPFPTQRDEESA